MDSTLTFRNEDGSTDLWRCREMPLDLVLDRERHSPLGEAFLFWSNFVHPTSAFDFSPGKAKTDAPSETARPYPSLSPVFRVDCGSSNPFDFRIGLPDRPDEAQTIRNVAPDHVRRILALDLNYAKGSRKPLYQEICQQIDGKTQECYRLLLPILGVRADVTEIFGFCRPATTVKPARARIRNKDRIEDR